MTNSQDARLVFDTTLLKAGAVLAGSGLVLATLGTGLAGLAVTRAARDWMRQRETSPTAAAAEKVRRARHATVAGAHAWHEFPHGANGVSTQR